MDVVGVGGSGDQSRELRSKMMPVLRRLTSLAGGGEIERADFEDAVAQLRLDVAGSRRLASALDSLGLRVKASVTRLPELNPQVSGQQLQTGSALPVSRVASKATLETGSEDRELREAVAAARARINDDRFIAKPQNIILTAQQEVGLALLIRGWPRTPGREPNEAHLAALEPGDLRGLAYRTLVLHNIRLVYKEVRDYAAEGLEQEDLAHYGVLGVMHAACKFDPMRGFKFSTYATAWIRQSVTRAIADYGSAIRIPVHLHEDMRRVARAESRLRGQGKFAGVVDVAVATGLPVHRVEEIRRLSRVTDSLDREIADGAHLGDLIGIRYASAPPEEVLLPRWERERVESMLALLGEREADIIRRRIGIIGGERQTLDEIGMIYGVTRERIRQLEKKACEELRRYTKALESSALPTVRETFFMEEDGLTYLPPASDARDFENWLREWLKRPTAPGR